MQTKQKDTSDTLGNVENNHNSNSTLHERTEIVGTPFHLVNQNEEYFITMGDYRLTIPTKKQEDTIQKLITEHWRITLTMIAIALDKQKIFEKKLPD